MSVDAVACFPLQAQLQAIQLAVTKVSHPATTPADQVMMVLARLLPLQIASAGIAYMDLAEQAVLLQQLKRAVYRDQPYTGIFPMQPFMDIGRPQVLSALAQNGYYGFPLRCQLESPLPQLSHNIVIGHVSIVK
jgi:hypothetical protein